MGQAASEWRRVLIVDDDLDTREMYSESLRADGFEAMAASSGEEALRLAAHFIPAVVVTDLRLRGKMDGLELARRLRADARTAATRVIMLTGASLGDERRHARAAGCDRFVLKPCLPEQLAAEIRNLATRTESSSRASTRRSPKKTPGERRKA